MTDYDVLVVGAGILGLSSAYHIKLADPSLKVLVVDKNVAAGLGSTVNSAAAFRCFFSSTANFALADSSVEFYRHLQGDLGVDLKMRWCGYLWCFTQDAFGQVASVLEELKAKGFEYKEYLPQELSRILGLRVSFAADHEAQRLGLGNVYRAVFVPKAGLIGVMSLVHFYEFEFLRLGGEIQYLTEVSKLLVEPKVPVGLTGEPYFLQDASVVGAETSSGVIRAKKTVVAAGAWISQLLDPVGIECFVKARKRQVFNVKADTPALKTLMRTTGFTEAAILPFTVLPKPAVYLRPNIDGEGFGIGFADEFPRAFRLEEHPKPENEFYQNGLQPIVAKYFPQFEGATSSGGFAGLYEVNTLDEQPVIFGEHGVVVVGGGSGSGIMKADAIGRIAAAVYAGQKFATLFGGPQFRVRDLGLKERRVEQEKLVI
jgi:FAD-dependent oxidoreductase domain-containing protein 1